MRVDILGVGILGRTPFEHFFFFQPLFSKPLTESSNSLNTLELHTILCLATHAYMHELCKKVILPRSGHKTYISIFLLAFFDLGL